MISQSLIWHIITSFFARLVNSVKNSMVFTALMRFSDWITKTVKESCLYFWLGKDSFAEKYYNFSVFYGIIGKFWNFILNTVRKAELFVRKIFKNSLCLRLFDGAQSRGLLSVDVFLAVFIGIMFIMPHERWNNLYAFLAACFFAFWILLNIASGKLRGRNVCGVGISMVIFIAAIVVSTVTAYVFSDALRIALFLIASILFAYSIYASVDTKEKLARFVKIILTFVTVTALYGIMQRIRGVEVDLEFVDITTNEGMPGRVFSTFSNPNNFAELLILFLPFFVPVFFSVKSKLEKLLASFGFAATVGALAMTYSRSCWVGFAISAIVFVCLYDKRLLIPLGAIVIVAIPFLPDTIINRIFTIGSMKDSSNSYRIYIWEGCINMIRDHGITGIGLGPASFRCVYPGYSSPVAVTAPHSHMLYMEIIIEMGIMGAVGFFGYVFGAVKKTGGIMRKMDKNMKMYAVASISALAGIAFASFAEYVWFYPRIMFAFWVVLGLLMSIVRITRSDA